MYYASDIETLADVIAKLAWNETTISERADRFAGKANVVWPSYLPEEEEAQEAVGTDKPASGTGRNCNYDYTKYSLNGNPATSKSLFVLDVVRAYVAKHPDKTFAELEEVFPITLCSKGFKHIGFLCSEEKHAAWDNKYKFKRYSIGQPDGHPHFRRRNQILRQYAMGHRWNARNRQTRQI